MDYNDLELLDYVQEGNEEAFSVLCEKYEPYIQNRAKSLMKSTHNGLDIHDLMQEGRVALSEAIKGFKTSCNTTFYTYATTCIERRMISTLISAERLKHKILNESISLDRDLGDGETVSLENLVVNEENNPETLILSEERERILFGQLRDVLTDFEYQVFELKYHNFNYHEIAKILEKSDKAIDNALHRMRVKISKFLENEKKEEKN